MRVMGIVNVTPDSFSDGGRYLDVDAAVAHGRALVRAGADLLDVGGESTRPGAVGVPPEEERERVLPVVRALRDVGVPLSVDTRRASVAAAAVSAGASMVNDVSGGADPAMWPLVADLGCGYVLMHTRGEPSTMMALAAYGDVGAEVWGELEVRVTAALAAGIAPERLWWDPGIGFAKTGAHNLALLRDLPSRTAGRRVLVGASRKRFIGELTGEPVAERRVGGSIAVALHAAAAGVDICRVHDVAETVQALAVWRALGGVPA